MPASDSAGSSAESFEDQASTSSDREFSAQEPESSESLGALNDQSQRSTQEKAPLSGAADADANLSALSSTTALKAQVRRLRPEAAATSSFSGFDCLVDRADSEDHVSVTYEGEPGVLVYRPPAAGRQRVDIYLCGVADPMRSVRLRAR